MLLADCKPAEQREQLYLPATLCTVVNGSRFEQNTEDVLSRGVNVVTPVWGDCHVCMDKFTRWDSLLCAEGLELNILFVVCTSYPDFFLSTLYPDIPKNKCFRIVLDSTGYFNGRNNLKLEDSHLNTFLVKNSTQIILRGNPLHDDRLMQQYKTLIRAHLSLR